MIAQNTIRGQIQVIRRQKIITAVHLFFRYKDFSGNEKRDLIEQQTNVLSGINYYFEKENWVFRERARHNSTLFFAGVLQALNNSESTAEQTLEQLVVKYVELLFEKPDFAAYLITTTSSVTSKTDLRPSSSHNGLEFLVISKTRALYSCNPLPVIISLIGMLLLPLAMISLAENDPFLDFHEFEDLIQERKKLLPLWIGSVTF